MLRDVLCVVGAGEEALASLAQGIALSAGYDVALTYVAVVPGPPPLSNIFGTDIVDSLVHEAKARAAEDAEQVSRAISSAMLRRGSKGEVLKEARPLAEAAANVAALAQGHDLTILERPRSFTGIQSSIFETAVFSAGRPILLAVPGRAPERFHKAVFAWDGSAHATRALAAAISLFPDLEEITVLTVLREKNLDDLVPGSAMASHIRVHGIKATVACVDLDQFAESAGPAISNFAKAGGFDLIVMGAYGHSRLREFLLGGVTEYLCRSANRPVLLAH